MSKETTKKKGKFKQEKEVLRVLHVGELSCGTPCCSVLLVVVVYKGSAGSWRNSWKRNPLEVYNLNEHHLLVKLLSSCMFHGSGKGLKARTVQITEQFLCTMHYFLDQYP